MKGKFMIIAALLGALTFGACVDSEESASVTAVRNAKAEQLKSVATLNNAKAQAEATIAAAEAQLLAAQAQKIAAESAALNAETEAQKIANQVAAAQAEAVIAQIEAEMELALLEYQTELLEAQAAFIGTANAHMVALYSAYAENLDELATAKAALVSAQKELALAEAGFVDIEKAHNDAVAKAQAELESLKSQKAAKEAALKQVKELSTYGMTWEELCEYVDNEIPNYREVLVAAAVAEDNAAAAEKASNDHNNKVANKDKSEYATYKYYFEALSTPSVFEAFIEADDEYDYILPEWKNDIAYDHDGDKGAKTAARTSKGFVNSDNDEVALYYAGASTTNIGDNGKTATSSSKWSYSHVNYDGDIIAENIAAYEAEALALVEAFYAPKFEKMAVDVAAAKSVFEKKNENKVSEKTQMEARIADWAKVVEARAKYVKQYNENNAIIAAYADVQGMPTSAGEEIVDKDDYNGDYDYSYYKTSFNIVLKAWEKVEEATSWLTDFRSAPATGTTDAIYTAQKNWLKTLKSVDTDGDPLWDDTDSINGIYLDLVDYFDAEGEYVDEDNSYLAMVAAEAALTVNYENNIAYVEFLVSCLEGMAAEYENWVAFAITEKNDKAKAAAKARYEATQKRNAANSFETTFAQIEAIVTAAGTEAGEKNLELAYAAKIEELNADIKTLNGKISAQEDIVKSKLETKIETAEEAIAELKDAVAKAEYAVAVAEANLAVSKAALDAALEE